MRLIDADTFKENMERKYGFYARQPQDDIDAQPTVDAIPIVRCKDCVHRDPEDKKCDCGSNARQGCPFPVDDNYFCGYGERRDGEHD